MKRSLLIAGITVIAITSIFSSCKKDHTCTCVYYINGVQQSAGNFTFNDMRDDAQNSCNLKQSSAFPNIPYPVTCDLK